MGFFSGISKGFKDVVGGLTGSSAAKATEKGSETAAAAQMEQLKYLKEVNKLPQEYRDAALTELAGLSGIGDGETQQDLIDRAKQSPIYSAIMGGKEAGEEAIMRSAGATGGLRSGNIQSNLADFSSDLQNEALLTAYNEQKQNLKGLAGLDTGISQIGQSISDIGMTRAQGITGAAQARQAGLQNTMNMALKAAALI